MSLLQDTASKSLTRRGIVPLNTMPAPFVGDYETTYQRAYFEQRDEPRACSSTVRVHRAGPTGSVEGGGSVAQALSQSRTSMADSKSLSRDAFSNPARRVSPEKPGVRFTRIQQPKASPPQYPAPLEPNRLRCK